MGSRTGENSINILILKEIYPPRETALHFLPFPPLDPLLREEGYREPHRVFASSASL